MEKTLEASRIFVIMLLNESFCSIHIHTNRTNANKISVNDDRVDKAELPKRRAKFRDLLRRMCPGIVGIRYELADGDKLHIRGGFSQDLHLQIFINRQDYDMLA